MRCVSAVLICALSVLVAPRASAATPLNWRIDTFANEFWVLDKLAGWDGDSPSAYADVFEQRFKLDDARRDLLRRYAAVRRAHADRPHRAADVRTPVDLMPPTAELAERFAIAFLDAPDERTAVATLGLAATERKAVLDAFHAFRKDIDTLLADSAYLEGAKRALVADAERARLDEYLDSMKAFYAIDDTAPYTVHMLWAPPGFGEATVWDHDIVLPITAKTAGDAKDLASWLGVVVHELGHAFLTEKPDAAKAEISRRIVDAAGILNRRHSNILDEATQTALGNILFTRTRLPEGFDARSFYSYERDGQYPDAIDSLARAVEPLVKASLATHDGFATVYLPKALDAQRAVFGDAPLHHAHVGLLFTADRDAASHFEGLFYSRSRWGYDPAHVEEFVTDSRANPTITRWVVLTQAEATVELIGKLEVPILQVAALGRHAACARAARRGANAGYDVWVIGRDGDALRRILIQLHRAHAMPEAKPLCLAH